jgi:exopolysaccharide biosynthesis polyprenyl glycosylphosphotransferase
MNKKYYRKKLLIFCGDIMIIICSLYLAPFIRYKDFPNPLSFLGSDVFVALSVYIFVLYFFDFYNFEKKITKLTFVMKLLLAIFTINIANASLFYLLHLRPYSSWVLFISSSLTLIFLMIWRIIFIFLINATKKPVNILIYGAGKSGKALYKLLKSISGYQVIGFVDDDEKKHELIINGLPVLGGGNKLPDFVEKYAVNKVIVCAGKGIRLDLYPLLIKAKFMGVAVYEMPTFYEKIAGKIPVIHTSDVWMGYSNISGVKKNIYNFKFKNFIDKTLAVIILIITAPLAVLTAIFIKMESKGPVIYAQSRVGLGENIFTLYKFRSMHIDAEVNGAVWAQKNDPRITRVGKVTRFLRIDELPQLWNVLKGEMSFVGPRPERPEFVKQLGEKIPYYMLRHSVKPGITGWAQINYKYGASQEDAQEKLQFDLYYIKNRDFILDLYIMLRTMRVMISGTGSI